MGWMMLMGMIVVDLRHRPQGPRAFLGGHSRSDHHPGRPGICAPQGRSNRCLTATKRPTPVELHELVAEEFLSEGYIRIDPDNPAYGQAQAAASEFIEEDGALTAGQYQVTDVFDVGGERYPLIANNESLDFFAFFHKPHYTVVEVSPLVPVRTEPGRAPALPQIDDDAQKQYVYMIRDLGAKRQPAVVLTIGGGAIFLALCYLLHRRERILKHNLSTAVATA